MNRSSTIIGIYVAILTISLWAFLNRPEQEPLWPQRIQGFSFSPMQADDDPMKSLLPSEGEIEADLALLAGTTHAIRTYSVEGVQGKIPELARKYKINVALGAWIDSRLDNNEMELARFLKILGHSRNIVRAIVGNEVVLRNDVSLDTLCDYLDRVRRVTDIPVSTAEPWHVWIKNPGLADHVDYIAVHMLPYWEGIDIDISVGYILDKMGELKAAYPGKPIVIAEVGWPSNGRTRMSAVASLANQAIFLRRFLEKAEKEKYIYYVMEAFDQPWKRTNEGAVGAYWGVYDVQRRAKFPFTDPIVPIPCWYILAGISVIIAGLTLCLLFLDSRTLGEQGRGFLAVMAYGSATAAVWVVYDYIHQYLTMTTIAVGILMFCGMVGVIIVLLTEAHEWAEANWFYRRRRTITPVYGVDDKTLPFVSIHVPSYNEPPEMLKQTLNALSKLNYPQFEVLVIDNNTKESDRWVPVRAHCQKLGQRFRFFHVDPLAGYKSGALNFALRNTDQKAKIVAVIDSDYCVNPNWLRELVPHFNTETVALVQAPQNYRDADDNLFKAMCYSEYRGFFHIGMVTRNERNAIIQHGTMTLVRKSVLEEVDGWSEWCITEDAELGLKIFKKGYDAYYIPRNYGKGLMPDSFQDYKKQRFRWAYGAIQILKRHLACLLGFEKCQLTYGQRYHFIAGWLPWLSDGINLIFNFAAIAWSIAMIVDPRKVDPPLMELSVLPITFFTFKTAKMAYLYHSRVKATLAQTLSAGLAGLALSHTIATAVLSGFFTHDMAFVRTPKWVQKSVFFPAILSVWQELSMFIVLILSAIGVYTLRISPSPDLDIWTLVLLIQSLPYCCAFILALISGLPHLTVSGVLNRFQAVNKLFKNSGTIPAK